MIDFGIASSVQGDMTSVYKDVFTGTLNYMSPEAVNYVQCPTGPNAGYRVSIYYSFFFYFLDVIRNVYVKFLYLH